jgi:hypothetical protein
MAKIAQILAKFVAAVVGFVGVAFAAFKMFNKGPPASVSEPPPEAQLDQCLLQNQSEATDRVVATEEKRQSDIISQIDRVNLQIAAEQRRIEGLSRDAVAAELRSLDSSAPTLGGTPNSSAKDPGKTGSA